MIKRRHGSFMILFLMLTSMMLTISLSCWYKMSLLADLLASREKHYQNLYLAEIFFTEAATFVQESFDFFNNQKSVVGNKTPFIFSIEASPFFNGALVKGKLIVTPYTSLEHTLEIVVSTYQKEKILFAIRGLLTKKLHPGKDYAEKKFSYQLHCLTFGVSF